MIRQLAVVTALGAGAIGAWLVGEAILGNPGGQTWSAEFSNARGLLAGNDVRVRGAVAGRITSISLSHDGRALVRFQLSAPAAAPRADAVATIEPADLLGDVYLALSPGHAREGLRGAIPISRTVNAPRLDEVLDAFSPAVRDGFGTMVVEAGLALDEHGGDLARTVAAVRPALSAAGAVLTELNAQNGALARVVVAAQRAVSQLDSRRGDIGPLIDNLDGTLTATASVTTPLDTGLSSLPGTLSTLRRTAGGISAAAAAATPLAASLESIAQPLGNVVGSVPPLVARARAAIRSFERALSVAGTTLRTGAPALSRISAAFPVLRRQAPGISTVLGKLDAAAPGIAQGFFVDFPDQAAESGRQPLDPFADPRRAYWRGAAVFSCEAFGVPVKPGCMAKALANLLRQPTLASDHVRTASQLLDYLLKR